MKLRLSLMSNALMGVAALLAALSLTLWAFGSDSKSEGPLRLDVAEKSFGDVVEQEMITVAFRIANTTDRPVQILGSHNFVCTYTACFKARNLPLTIAPGKSEEVIFESPARSPGVVNSPSVLFTTCDGAPKLHLTIRGRVISQSESS